MRAAILLLGIMAVTACVAAPPSPRPHSRPVPRKAPPPKPPAPPAAPAHPITAPALASSECAGIQCEGVAFDARSHRLVVADQPAGPGSRWPDAATAMADRHGLAAANAGFFTPEGAPLGRVVSGGTTAGAWNRSSSLGSAAWLEDATGRTRIERREKLATTPARELVQAGPLLVENARTVPGLEAGKASVRTVLLWDGGVRWWLGRTSACTLAELGRALAAASPCPWPVRHALNLDGGRSSDLAVSAAIPGGPLTRRAVWNRPVRNFLVLVPR